MTISKHFFDANFEQTSLWLDHQLQLRLDILHQFYCKVFSKHSKNIWRVVDIIENKFTDDISKLHEKKIRDCIGFAFCNNFCGQIWYDWHVINLNQNIWPDIWRRWVWFPHERFFSRRPYSKFQNKRFLIHTNFQFQSV